MYESQVNVDIDYTSFYRRKINFAIYYNYSDFIFLSSLINHSFFVFFYVRGKKS